MPAPGQNFNQTIVVAEPVDRVSQLIIAAVSGVPDSTVTTAGTGSIVVTRKFRPAWTIVVAVIGLIFFLIGLLALLYTETETLTITLAADGEGTRVVVSGRASQELLARLTAALGSLTASTGAGSAHATLAAQMPSDAKQCPQCAETIKAEAKICRFCNAEQTQ